MLLKLLIHVVVRSCIQSTPPLTQTLKFTSTNIKTGYMLMDINDKYP